jgi:hypothetical protein
VCVNATLLVRTLHVAAAFTAGSGSGALTVTLTIADGTGQLQVTCQGATAATALRCRPGQVLQLVEHSTSTVR